jgi:hypothetical protein
MECETDAVAKVLVAINLGCDPECTSCNSDTWVYFEYTYHRDFCAGDGGFLYFWAFNLASGLAIIS